MCWAGLVAGAPMQLHGTHEQLDVEAGLKGCWSASAGQT